MRDDDDVPRLGRPDDGCRDQVAEVLGALDAAEVDLDRPPRLPPLGVGDRLRKEPFGACRLDDDRLVGEPEPEQAGDGFADGTAFGPIGMGDADDRRVHRLRSYVTRLRVTSGTGRSPRRLPDMSGGFGGGEP